MTRKLAMNDEERKAWHDMSPEGRDMAVAEALARLEREQKVRKREDGKWELTPLGVETAP